MHPVIVRYTAKAGAQDTLRPLVEQHWTTLHAAGLTTDRPAVVVRLERDPGVFLEYYEWASNEAVAHAHEDPDVRRLWGRMEEVATVEPWDGRYVVNPSHALASGR